MLAAFILSAAAKISRRAGDSAVSWANWAVGKIVLSSQVVGVPLDKSKVHPSSPITAAALARWLREDPVGGFQAKLQVSPKLLQFVPYRIATQLALMN